MEVRRGSPYSFWGTKGATTYALTGEVVTAVQNSRAVEIGRGGVNMCSVWVNASGAFTAKVQVAHTGFIDPSNPEVVLGFVATDFKDSRVWETGDQTSGGAGTGPGGGVGPDTDIEALAWYDLSYLGTAVTVTLAGSGSACVIIPDFEPGYIRLQATTAAGVSVIAGHEAWGD